MSGQSFAAVSLAKLRECTSSSTTDRFDGVFGRDFFKKLVVEIDHRHRTLGLHDPTLYKYGGEGQKIPLEIEKNFTYVRVTVEAADKRKVPARLVLDTGAGVGLWLTRDFAESNKLIPPDDALSSFEDCGIGGPTKAPARAGHLSALWLGRDRLKKPQVVFFSEPLIAGSDGFLGAPTLENYNATFDYGRAVLVLKRN
jgi:hypothetical protein